MKRILTIIFLIVCTTSITAQQTTVSAGNETATAGDSVVVPIDVSNFNNVGSISIKIQYDETVLSWGRALNWNSQLGTENVIANASNGVISIGWFSLTPINITQGKLVDLKFLYNGASSTLDFLEAECEITDEQGNTISVTYINGSVTPGTNLINVTVNTNPNGRSFTVDGNTYTTQQTFNWNPGASHTIGTTSPQSGGTDIRYVWSSWNDGGAMTHTVTPSNDITYTAYFDTEYYLTMQAGTGGSVTPSSGWRQNGESVQIEAFPNSGYSFDSWSGTGNGAYSGSNNPATITMNAPISETANFVQPQGENPTVSINYPPNWYYSPNQTITLEGIADDPDGSVVEVQVKVGNVWETANGTTSWNYTVSLSTDINNFLVRALDNQGNYTDPPVEINVIYDPIVNDYWSQQGSNTSDDLNSVFFLNDQLGWAVGAAYGNHATILKTTNGGTDWNILSEPILSGASYISTCFFINSNTGWIAGFDNNLLKTTDGGVTWVQQLTQNYGDFLSLYFINSSIGWAVGVNYTASTANSILLKTTNGGSNWTQQNLNLPISIKSVYFIDQTFGWICGDGGTIKATTDGGNSWITQNTDDNVILNSIKINGNGINGWAVGVANDPVNNINQGIAYLTTNGGATWSYQLIQDTKWFFDCEFTDLNNGWAAGYDIEGKGIIINTTDGGNTWGTQASGLRNIIRDLSFPNQNTGWAVGEGGILLNYHETVQNQPPFVYIQSPIEGETFLDPNITVNGTAGDNDGTVTSVFVKLNNGAWQSATVNSNNWDIQLTLSEGSNIIYAKAVDNLGSESSTDSVSVLYSSNSNWSHQTSDPDNALRDVFFINDQIGWAVGINYQGGNTKGVIIKTTNGGANWNHLTYIASGALLSVWFIDSNTGWCAGENGTIVKTTDGGATWVNQNLQPTYLLEKIQFINGNTGWTIGAKNVYKTTNGGSSWFVVHTFDYTDCTALFFLDSNVGWISGIQGDIYKTTDGGQNWVSQRPDFGDHLYDAYFYDNQHGWIAGDAISDPEGLIMLTTDGGTNWNYSLVNPNPLNSVYFINANEGFAVGWTGRILHTTDSGNTWAIEASGTVKDLRGVYFPSANNGWTVGDEGTILKYHSGNTQHFTPIWSGNPYLPMNTFVTSATLDSNDLDAGDEIALFDGNNCVGVAQLSGPIIPGNPIQIIASKDDPDTPELDGFIDGDSIIYKYWDGTNLVEISNVIPSYTLGGPDFIGQGTAVVDLNAQTVYTQNISLTTGWNIFSLNVVPPDPDMLSILDTLILNDELIKAQDEAGNAVVYLPGIGWINTIGNWEDTEGYYIKTNTNTSLIVSGSSVLTPLDIPLTQGWNIISYPCQSPQNALDVLQPLIDAGVLIKAQDEAGNAVVYLPGIGWLNTIGNFEYGEGYYVKVNTSTILNINCPNIMTTPETITYQNLKKNVEEPNHFDVPFEKNPYQPMNIILKLKNIADFKNSEMGIFADGLCVGATTLGNNITTNDSINLIQIIASKDDPTTESIDGFTDGQEIKLRMWDSELLKEISVPSLSENVDKIFSSRGTIILTVDLDKIYMDEVPTEFVLENNYPNPFNPSTIIRYGLPSDSYVKLEIFDITGKRVNTLVNEMQKAGYHNVTFSAENLASGVYLYRIIAGKFIKTKKLLLLK